MKRLADVALGALIFIDVVLAVVVGLFTVTLALFLKDFIQNL